MKNTVKWVIMFALAVLCAGGIGTSIFLCLKTSDDLKTVTESVGSIAEMTKETDGKVKLLGVDLSDLIEEQKAEEETKENDVTIAGEYEIRATTQISDAYKSGDDSGLSDEDKETLKMASDIIDEIITDDMTTDFEKEKAVYEWLCMYTTQSSDMLAGLLAGSSDQYTPHGVLTGHQAVCVGYATTFRLFMQMLDIECMVVHNTECYHSWDLVKLDGEWYHTDVYSDAGSANYRNFNLNDAARSAMGHQWDRTFFPEATGTKYNYASMMSKPVKNIYRLPKDVKKMIDDKNGTKYYSFTKEEAEKNYSVIENMMYQCQSRLDMGMYGNMWMSWDWSAVKKDGEDVFLLSVSVQSNEEQFDSTELTDEQLQKIEEAIAKAFGDGGDMGMDGEMPMDQDVNVYKESATEEIVAAQ